jgi:benzoate/toluate 1,2-dioxygenase subunit alpha
MNKPTEFGARPEIDFASLIKPDRVHRSVYTDPAIFEVEMDRIYGQGWVFVGHESEVPEPGDFKTDKVGPLSFVMVRGDDGQVRLFHNVCTHRGARLCHRDYGQTQSFMCMYHGWSFNTRGDLDGVPLKERFPDFDMAEFGLKPIARVDSHRGFLFASKNPDVMPLLEFLGRAAHYLDLMVDRAPDGEIEAVKPVKYHYEGNWKLQMENYADNYHPPVLHGSALSVGMQIMKEKFGDADLSHRSAVSKYYERAFGHGHMMADLGPMRPGIWMNAYNDEFRDQLVADHGAETARQIMEMDLHMIVYPNLLLHSRMNHYRLIKPVSVDYTEVATYPCKLKGAPKSVNDVLIQNSSHHCSAVGEIQVDDMQAFKWVQEGLGSEGIDWVLMKLTGEDEHINADGELEWFGASEGGLRVQYQEWLAQMT